MSTRRARIKAVTSLPPRRKNAEVAENKVKETFEKSTKSPRTPLVENKSPRQKNVTESKTLENIAHSMIEKLITSEKPQNLSVTEDLSKASTPIVLHTPEKIHSIENKKNSVNVFASPARRDSPKKTFASPIAPSPKVIKCPDLQRPQTPQRATPTAHKITDNNELQIAERIVSKIDHNVNSKKDNARDDYNIPSVPESTDDEAMDGIVPLKPAASVPKPIDVLKNQIISENAEVLFDPIIPLPSPTKVRPKLRPVPRLAPLRRSSVQGSASESEDENRRNFLNSKDRQAQDVHTLQSLPNRDVSRVRNDSVCSSVSQATQPAAAASPVGDKQQISKTRRQEEARRRMAMRRRREHAKRDTLTMYDLIFYNPTSNPLVLSEDEIKLKEAKEKQEAERIEKEKEAAVKPPDSPKKSIEPAAVPQIKLGPKGEIILDEQSLVIKQTESDRKVSSVVHEGAWGTGGQYKKLNFCRTAGWSAPETVRFYRALAALGTDFTLMAQLFPDRTRKQLKDKFKKEERLNGAQIDKALRATLQFDVALLKAEFEEERVLAAKQAEMEREKLNNEKQAERERLKTAREARMRQSRGMKALEASKVNVHHNAINTDDIIEHHISSLNKQKSKPRQPITPLPKISTLARVSSASKSKDMANSRTNTSSLQIKTPEAINALQIPTNIETGSLVVLTVNDPSSPAKKMLQTYVANGPGKLTPVALPASILNYVVGYMKKGTPKGSNMSSPLLSPSSITSVESHNSAPCSIPVMPSPAKRQRHSSYTITQL